MPRAIKVGLSRLLRLSRGADRHRARLFQGAGARCRDGVLRQRAADQRRRRLGRYRFRRLRHVGRGNLSRRKASSSLIAASGACRRRASTPWAPISPRPKPMRQGLPRPRILPATASRSSSSAPASITVAPSRRSNSAAFSLSSVTVKPLQSNTNVIAALGGGTIDAAVLPGNHRRRGDRRATRNSSAGSAISQPAWSRPAPVSPRPNPRTRAARW